MYRIRLKTNKRVDEYGKDDTATVGVRLKNGELRYMRWQGFTLTIEHPVKLRVEGFTLDPGWDPRNTSSVMPRWHQLRDDEFLLGSYGAGVVKTYLPFTIVTETGRGAAPGRGGAHPEKS